MRKSGPTADEGLDPAAILGDQAARAGVNALLGALTVPQIVKDVLTLRYGLDGGGERSTEIIALTLRIAEETVEQHLQTGLDALRAPDQQQQLHELIDR